MLFGIELQEFGAGEEIRNLNHSRFRRTRAECAVAFDAGRVLLAPSRELGVKGSSGSSGSKTTSTPELGEKTTSKFLQGFTAIVTTTWHFNHSHPPDLSPTLNQEFSAQALESWTGRTRKKVRCSNLETLLQRPVASACVMSVSLYTTSP